MCFKNLFKKKTAIPTPEPIVQPPVLWKPTTEFQFTSDQIFVVTNPIAKEHIYLWDNTYWVVSLEDWKKIFDDVLNNMPLYTAERFDCDKFAMLCASRIYERYQLNTCAVAEGQSPVGEHAFNLFVSWENDKLTPHVLEPQSGLIDPPNYLMDILLFG